MAKKKLKKIDEKKAIGNLINALTPLITEVVVELVKMDKPIKVTKKPQKKTTKRGRPKKAKVDYRHDLCKCGKVKLKQSPRCKACEIKRRKKKKK
tara:strand:+ start:3287 stop:3571 length:285 start_codon:yes stop_codon:yes gene_type:complete